MIRVIISFLLVNIFIVFCFGNDDRAIYKKKYSKEQKVALIIGNSNYSHFSKLKNAHHDADDMSKVLKNLGFEILYLKNGSLKDMKKTVRRFSNRIKDGGVGLFFYAGHGIEVDGKNYLIPIDADIPEKNEVEYESLAVDMIIDKMEEAKNRLNIVVLDACRNDPFSRSGSGGLAQINNAKGMYIAFATAPGSVASDGSGRNGLFTKHLIYNMQQKDLELEKVFKKTRIGVLKESNERQMPWTSSSVSGDFYFNIGDVENINIYQSTPKEESINKQQSQSFVSNKPQRQGLSGRKGPPDEAVMKKMQEENKQEIMSQRMGEIQKMMMEKMQRERIEQMQGGGM